MVIFQDGNKKVLGDVSNPNYNLTKALADAKEKRLKYSKGITDAYTDTVIQEEIEAPTFAQMTLKYFEWAKTHKKANTIDTEFRQVKNHIAPLLGSKKINKIKTRDISSTLESIIDKKTKYSYLSHIKDIYIQNITQNDFLNILKELGYNDNVSHDIEELGYKRFEVLVDYYITDKLAIKKYFNKHAKYYTVTKVTTKGSANRIKATLSHMFNTAMTWNEPEWECLTHNPCIGVKSTQSKSKTRYLDKEELERLNKVLSEDLYKNDTVANLLKFLLMTGSRKSEALTARWEHIDFINKIWRRPTSSSKTKLAPPVPLSKKAIELLELIKENEGNKGYIFKSKVYPDKHLGEFRKSFATIMKKSNIENCTPHDLRRTFGTQLLLAGVDIYAVSKLLGHNSVATTEKHYAFLNRETLHNAVNTLDNIMG